MIRLTRFVTILLAAFLASLIGWNPDPAVAAKASSDQIVVDTSPRFELARYYPEAGENQPTTGVKGTIERWLHEHPFFKRHPHPAVVHFPLALLVAAALFAVLALPTSSAHTEWASYCCLLLGTLAIPVAMVTGYFTWWINYVSLEAPLIYIKRGLAWVALVLAIFAVLLRSFVIEDPLQRRNAYNIIYFITLLILAGVVSGVGDLGGAITFPY